MAGFFGNTILTGFTLKKDEFWPALLSGKNSIIMNLAKNSLSLTVNPVAKKIKTNNLFTTPSPKKTRQIQIIAFSLCSNGTQVI